VQNLTQALGHILESACGACLSGRKLPAVSVERQIALDRKIVSPDELGHLAFCAKAKVLDLHGNDDGIIIVDLQHIDVRRRYAGRLPEAVDVHGPTPAQLHRVLRESVVALDRGKNLRHLLPKRLSPFRGGHDKRLGACTRHDAIEQVDRIGNRARRHVGIQREGLALQGQRVRSGIGALRHAKLAKFLTRHTIFAHVRVGDQGKSGVGAAKSIRIDGVLRKPRKAGKTVAEAIDLVGVCSKAYNQLGVATLHGPCRTAQGHHPACPAGRDMVQPAWAKSQMLDHPDR